MSTPITPNPGESIAQAIERTEPARKAEQKAQLDRLSGNVPDPNAGRIGGLPLTSRPGNVPQPVEKAAAIEAPVAQPRAADGTFAAPPAPIPAVPAGGVVHDARHQQQIQQGIRAAIDPESERIINAKYAAMTPEQREKAQTGYFNDLVRLREGHRIVNGQWVAPASAATPAQFTSSDIAGVETVPERNGRIAEARAELKALLDLADGGSGTPAQRAEAATKLPAATAKLQALLPAAPAAVPSNFIEATPANLSGYTLPDGVTHFDPGVVDQLRAARAAGITQAQVDAVIRADLAK